jgi:hypothetical protein
MGLPERSITLVAMDGMANLTDRCPDNPDCDGWQPCSAALGGRDGETGGRRAGETVGGRIGRILG